MIRLDGKWYDGKSSAQTDACCRIYDSGAVRVENKQTAALITSGSHADIRLSLRLADTPRYLYFPGGEKFETGDNDAADQIARRFRRPSMLRLVDRLERRWSYVLPALFVLILFLWATMRFGAPIAARKIAFLLPPAVMDMAGEQTAAVLDKSLFRPSELEKPVRTRLQRHFKPVIHDHLDFPLKIVFRKGGRIGPNAFALPNGTVIFTDEMVQLAAHDDELKTILLHEIGHVVHRHGMRSVIQDSLLGFVLLAITGDVSGSSELFLGLPVMLTELAYSRAFEHEADRYAIDYMRSHDIDPAHFARLMRRIEKKMAGPTGGRPHRPSSFLSTHPETARRLKRFEALSSGGPNRP